MAAVGEVGGVTRFRNRDALTGYYGVLRSTSAAATASANRLNHGGNRSPAYRPPRLLAHPQFHGEGLILWVVSGL